MSKSNNNIAIELIQFNEFNKIKRGCLVFRLHGYNSAISHAYVNSIQRAMMHYIPIYAFPKQLINLTNINDSEKYKFKYTMPAESQEELIHRFSYTPLFNIDNNIKLLEDRYIHIDDYSNRQIENIHPDELNISYTLHCVNDVITNYATKENIIYITANSATIEINNEIVIDMYDRKYAHPVAYLNPGEIIRCNMKAVLGIGKRHDIWSACTAFYFDINDEEKYPEHYDYTFTIKSYGQINEKRIMIKSIDYLIEIFVGIGKFIKSEIKKDDEQEYMLDVDHDLTLVNILNYEIQSNDNVIYSGIINDYKYNGLRIRVKLINKDVNLNDVLSASINKALDNLHLLRDTFNQFINNN